jgi:hypothetical protein
MSHEATWMEDRGKSSSGTIVFQCLLCTRTTQVKREDYENSRAFPAVTEHD